ncbi:phage holin [Caldanaerobacter subterraneus]|uniref:Phage holin n=1 Tax=Caldanaerobacter subterraneus TaxID=911092 RepID=A0A7Y2L7R0_9THEO|nr:phage holin [Caldanaerobacter subterraneus]NNG67363.1 phage holin [Caldanaerobacter subterraneus]
MSELWYNAIYNLLLLLAALAGVYLAGFLRRKVMNEKMEMILKELLTKKELAETAVKFVEQVYKDILKGEEKYNKAAEWLKIQFSKLGLSYTDEEIKGLIEAAVRTFKDTFGEEWAKQIK